MPTLSVTCFIGLPAPAGTLSRPFPAIDVAPLMPEFTPVVALSVILLTVPVVRPTAEFVVFVTAWVPFWRGLGFLVVLDGAGFEGLFGVVLGVGFMGVFLMGVFEVVGLLVAGFEVGAFCGVGLVGVLVAFVAAALISGCGAVDCRGMGRGFLVPMGVRGLVAGAFEVVTGAFFRVVVVAGFGASDVVVAFLVEAGGRGFLVPIGVLLGVSFFSGSAPECFCAGLGVSGALGVSFLGVLFTGVADVGSFVLVDAAAGFSAADLVAGFGSGLDAWTCFDILETFDTLSVI